ncbi:MAG: hydroxyacid dehydrogenase [Deltaproteobacteria bacterium]|nr:hydroxyacid dehydrogenase [Deltaproteobacteria bacterium]
MNVLICDGLDKEAIEQLQAAGHAVTVHRGIPKETLMELMPTCEAVVVRSATKITKDVIERGARLKLIVRAGVGIDNVDAATAEARGIAVRNTPAATSISVAEHTMALMLALARHVTRANASVKSGEWNRKAFEGTELYGKTLGVMGLGRIGAEVSKRARAFHMNVVAFDHIINMEVVNALDIEALELDALLQRSDYVTLHLPLVPETRHLINRERLALMKRGAYLINTARGELIDEAAVAEAVRSGQLAGAAVDVYCGEPPAQDHPLVGLPQVITVPHLGGSTGEGQRRAGLEVARIICEFR